MGRTIPGDLPAEITWKIMSFNLNRKNGFIMARQVFYRTVDGSGKEIETGTVRNRKAIILVYRNCVKRFGSCLAKLDQENLGNDKTWIFSQCIKDNKGNACAIRLTTVWIESE